MVCPFDGNAENIPHAQPAGVFKKGKEEKKESEAPLDKIN
jgi:hypothetical protein